ncbi:MAG: aminoglycoside phosphotransferase family protein [Caldilineaceae bacterium]
MLAEGVFEDADDWPYLITTVIKGVSLGEVRAQVDATDLGALAAIMGETLRQLHQLPIADEPFFAEMRRGFDALIRQQQEQCVAKHQKWRSLPDHLVAQIPGYLSAHADYHDTQKYCLIHADITEDHVLGEFRDGGWQPTGLIDFGDAQVGYWTYELTALYFSLFQADQRLLRIFFDAYAPSTPLPSDFVHQAMMASLLFEFNAFEAVENQCPRALTASTLDEMAHLLWDIA